jgi:hypothetical protein
MAVVIMDVPPTARARPACCSHATVTQRDLGS